MRSNSKLLATSVIAVVIAYVIGPLVAGWIVAFAIGFLHVLHDQSLLQNSAFVRRLESLQQFIGELTLLIGSGLLALWAWLKVGRSEFVYGKRFLPEIGLGGGVGIIQYFLTQKVISPWLNLARPAVALPLKPEYHIISSYGGSYVNQIASVFFVDVGYAPFVETIVFCLFLYQVVRSTWGYLPSVLVVSLLFAGAHENKLFFLGLFIFGLIYLTLFELRKSLVTPLASHIVFNALIYGSQLALFSSGI